MATNLILLVTTLSVLSLICGCIFCKKEKYSDPYYDNPLAMVFGILLILTILGGVIGSFKNSTGIGFISLTASVLPWLAYYSFYKYKMNKVEEHCKRLEEERKALKEKQSKCSHPTFTKYGFPTYDCAHGMDQKFKCTCCGHTVTMWPEWDGTFSSFGGKFISKSEIV